jgi:CheY-like chemotaxis protein
MNGKKPILLVEDDKIDQMTVKRALREINATNKLIITNNGEEALDYLQHPENESPTLILLDINMPRMNGIEFLKIIKKDERYRKIPVVILTTSKEDKDRFESFDLGVAGYMVKPVVYKVFVEVVQAIHEYWNLSEQPE